MENTVIINKLSMLPENMKQEVEHFIDFLIAKKEKPKSNKKPKFGSAKGVFKMKPNFDDPLPEFEPYM